LLGHITGYGLKFIRFTRFYAQLADFVDQTRHAMFGKFPDHRDGIVVENFSVRAGDSEPGFDIRSDGFRRG
jgi:hypothetical protein